MADLVSSIPLWQLGVFAIGMAFVMFQLAGISLVGMIYDSFRSKDEEQATAGLKFEEVNRLEPALLVTKFGTYEISRTRTVSADPLVDEIKGEIELSDGTVTRTTSKHVKIRNPFDAMRNKGGTVWELSDEPNEVDLLDKFRREKMKNAALNEENDEMHKEYTQVAKRMGESTSSIKKALYGGIGTASSGIGGGSPWYSSPYGGGFARRYGYGGYTGGIGGGEGGEGLEEGMGEG